VSLGPAALAWAARLVARLPYRALAPLGTLVGLFVGEVLRVRRAEVVGRLKQTGHAAASARAMYVSLGRGLFELLWAGGRPTRVLGAQVKLGPGAIEALERLEGRGAVIASAHTGNWDLAACALAERHPILIITKRLKVQALDGLWQGLRRGRGVGLADGRGAVAAARAALDEGRLVAVMIDQAPEGPGRALWHPFLGLPARHDRLAAALAARSGRPLIVAFPRREPDGTHLLDVAEVIEPPGAGAGPAWIDEATRRASAALEAFVRERPEQWLWLHRRWKAKPAPLPRPGAATANPEGLPLEWPRPAGHGSAPGP
jgi:Kdo2-lipid IVA lauroyltransferase/acyltransferase